nr:MAG TPA: hypothetical protein [Caudoviricetes sp.]
MYVLNKTYSYLRLNYTILLRTYSETCNMANFFNQEKNRVIFCSLN